MSESDALPPLTEPENPPISEPEPAPTEPDPIPAEPSTFVIAPLWRRVIGGLIDICVLMGTCIVLTPLFWLFAYPIGARWGRLIGFGLGVVYLGLANSSLTRGRTLGKLITGTRTVDRYGRTLIPFEAMVRGTFMSLIFIPDILYLPLLDTVSWVFSIGALLALVYGLLFNWQTRQTPYDLFGANSYVVRANQPADAVAPPRRKLHEQIPLALMALLVLPGLCGALIFGLQISSGQAVTGMYIGEDTEYRDFLRELVRELERQPEYVDAGVSTLKESTIAQGQMRRRTAFILTVVTSEQCELDTTGDCADQAELLAHHVYDQFLPSREYDIIQGRVVNRVDLGWYQSSTTIRFGLDPDDVE